MTQSINSSTFFPRSRKSMETARVESYMSASPVRICTGTFTHDAKENLHTESLRCRDGPMITRRGCTIVLEVSLSSCITCPYTVALTFIPVHGPRERSSMFKATGTAKGTSNLWLSIDLPTTFPVGYYDTLISVSIRGCSEIMTHLLHNAIAVLFNPWNKDDDTFIEDEQQRHLYCVNDVGVIWRGTIDYPQPRVWIYGQYEEQCLDTALMLIKGLSANERRKPWLVARELLSRIMPVDNSGILQSCYNGHYGGGTHPCKWNGSPCIIQKYYRTRTSVKYGQCWVACAVGVSLLRSIGILCRTVTCYDAAIPSGRTAKTMKEVHRYFTPEGSPVYDLEKDRVWCYHVLVECWMRRSDLPIGYDGWQLIDVSSPAPSAGIQFIAGPTPAIAIKEKHNNKAFGNDINILMAMINSEVHYHRVIHSHSNMSNRQCVLAKVLSNQCGRLIITNDSADCTKYINITAEYREDPPGAVASPQASSLYGYPPPSKDCSIELSCSQGELNEDFDITITLNNNGPMVRTLDGRVIVLATQYTGANPKPIISHEFSGKVTPSRNATVQLPVSYKQCLKQLTEQNILQIFTLVKARETQQLFTINRYHCSRPPSLSVSIKENTRQPLTVGSDIRVLASFRNIFPSSMSHAVFVIEGMGSYKEMSHRRVILPGRLVTVECCLRVHKLGDHLIIANMTSDKLHGLIGSTTISIS